MILYNKVKSALIQIIKIKWSTYVIISIKTNFIPNKKD